MPVSKPQTGNYLVLPQELILCPACVPAPVELLKSELQQLRGYSRCERCGEGKRTQLAPRQPRQLP
jgi:uncharacterized Zn finger protein